MKKLLTIMMTFAMAFCLAACGNAETNETTEKETITIKAYDANKEITDVEIPYDPQRIAILDMPALDIVDALGLGDRNRK